MITKVNAIVSLRPKSNFVMVNNVVTEWLDDTQTPPTDAEIQAEVIRLQQQYEADSYKRNRQAEYPPIGDQLDALWKGGAEAEAMLAKVQAVKQKFPKGVA